MLATTEDAARVEPFAIAAFDHHDVAGMERDVFHVEIRDLVGVKTQRNSGHPGIVRVLGHYHTRIPTGVNFGHNAVPLGPVHFVGAEDEHFVLGIRARQSAGLAQRVQ